MTFKTFSRAGLMALILGVFLGICVNVFFGHSLLCAGRSDAVMRLESPKRMLAQFRRHRLDAHLDGHCADDDIPGLGLFYGGMVRKKNVGDTVMTSFAITCLITILWLLFTTAWRSGRAVTSLATTWAGSSGDWTVSASRTS